MSDLSKLVHDPVTAALIAAGVAGYGTMIGEARLSAYEWSQAIYIRNIYENPELLINKQSMYTLTDASNVRSNRRYFALDFAVK